MLGPAGTPTCKLELDVFPSRQAVEIAPNSITALVGLATLRWGDAQDQNVLEHVEETLRQALLAARATKVHCPLSQVTNCLSACLCVLLCSCCLSACLCVLLRSCCLSACLCVLLRSCLFFFRCCLHYISFSTLCLLPFRFSSFPSSILSTAILHVFMCWS